MPWSIARRTLIALVTLVLATIVVFGAVQSLSEVPKIKPRPLLFYRGDYTGIEPDKTTPAQWRDDLEAFLTTTTQDTWL